MKEVEILTRSHFARSQTGAKRCFPLLLGVKGVLDRGPILVDAIRRLTGESGSATSEVASRRTPTGGTKKTEP